MSDDPQALEPLDWDAEPSPLAEYAASCPQGYLPVRVVPGYEALFDELVEALKQSQDGKGKERHANDLPFAEQPLMRLSRMCGPGGPAQQVMKKTQEALGMHGRGETDRAIAELHGAIIYAAATILTMKGAK